MRVLIVHSGNHAQVAPFITEQAEALREAGCEVQMFAVEGHGVQGYLRSLPALKKTIAEYRPNIVHAHYGLCGLLCTLQHGVPVVVTYHGSDINKRGIRQLSRLAMHRAAYSIFVSQKLLEKVHPNTHHSIIPCGVNTDVFHPMPRAEALKVLEQSPATQATLTIKQSSIQANKIILFAGAFDNEIKNPALAKDTCALMPEVTLLELKGYSRMEVAALMNVADALLMTSHSEGSPQVVKEAIACGLPVVSVDVGDVAETTAGVANCHIVKERSPQKLADAIMSVIKTSHTTAFPDEDSTLKRRVAECILTLDNSIIAKKLIDIYQSIIK